MDIIVMGKASKKFQPEEIVINITFSNKESTYEKCLEKGAKMVQDFVKKVLNEIGISKEELKTSRMFVNEVTRYIPEKSKRVFDGYNFNQSSKIVIDYDMKKFSKFMDLVSRLDIAPSYHASFGLKDEDKRKNEVIAEAINFARVKAMAISEASGKKLVDLLKVDFKPFTEALTGSTLNSYDLDFRNARDGFYNAEMCRKSCSADIIEQNFTPEDIEINETLYCLFLAQ